MCQQCAEGDRSITSANPAVHDMTVRDTQDYSAEDGAQADGTDNECNAATTENGICKTSALIHGDERERHFKDKKHQVKVKEFVGQEKLKPDRNGAEAKGSKDDGKRVHSGASKSRTKQQASCKGGGTY